MGTPDSISPSARLVLEYLQKGKPLTMKDLVDSSGLPRRTVYQCLRRLKDLAMVQEQVSLRDTRQTWYFPRRAHAGEAGSLPANHTTPA